MSASDKSQAEPNERCSANGASKNQSGITISVANLTGVSDKWAKMLQKADLNGDGLIDASEVVGIMEKMLKEQSMHHLFRYMTIGLFLVVAILIGALSGITWGIVQLSKDTKVSTYNNSTYQFLMTKDGKAAVTGSAALDLASLTFRTDGPSRRSLLSGGGMSGAGKRRFLGEVDESEWFYSGTIANDTVARACGMLDQNVIQFPVAVPNSQLFVNGSTLNVVKILHQTGCKSGDVNLVSAYVQADDGFNYLVYCDASIHGCDLWAYIGPQGGNSTNSTDSAGRRRRLLQNNQMIMPVPGKLLAATNVQEEEDTFRLPVPDCFPADATVDVLGKGAVRMDELQYGDLVRSVDRSTGAVAHRAVYLFGHRDKDSTSPYLHITAGGRTLAASKRHFVPVCVAGCTAEEYEAGSAVLENRRAEDVRIGDTVIVASPSPAFAAVTGLEVFRARGAYNPYVRGADLVVDGVLASPHSDWLLDPIAPARLVPLLPAIYEFLLAPVYGLYCIVGPETGEWLAHGLGLADAGRSGHAFYAGYWAVLAGVAVPVAAAVMLGRNVVKRRAVLGLKA